MCNSGALSGRTQRCLCISAANEANKDAHYGRSLSALTHTVAVVMASILIPLINLASDHSDQVFKEAGEGRQLEAASTWEQLPVLQLRRGTHGNLLRRCCSYRNIMTLHKPTRREITFTSRGLSSLSFYFFIFQSSVSILSAPPLSCQLTSFSRLHP